MPEDAAAVVAYPSRSSGLVRVPGLSAALSDHTLMGARIAVNA